MSLPAKFKSLTGKAFKNQFFRFILASGANTIFGFLTFSFFIFLGFHYPIAVFFSTICGILFNFQTIGRFVFFSKNNLLIFQFIGVYLVTYVLMTVGVGILIQIGMSAYLSGAILVMPIGIISFLLNKRFVFKK